VKYTIAEVHFGEGLHIRAVQPSPSHSGVRDIPQELYFSFNKLVFYIYIFFFAIYGQMMTTCTSLMCWNVADTSIEELGIYTG